MAEIVSCVIQLLNLIKSEASLLSGLQSEVSSIMDDLQSILVFLKTAERTADENEFLKDCVRQARKLAYEIEDVIEEYELYEKDKSLRNIVNPTHFLMRHKIADEIKSLRKRAAEIGGKINTYRYDSDFSQQGGMPIYSECMSMSMTEDSELVGEAKADLIELLRLHELDDSGLSTIAVSGMAGLGKTAVVWSVYNDEMVRDFFPIRAWVPASSQTFDFENMVLKRMYKQFYETYRASEPTRRNTRFDNDAYNIETYAVLDGINKTDTNSLRSQLKKFLAEKRYIVVFDDVQDGITWENIKSVLPIADTKGSKIVITTRYENVARAWVESNHGLYQLKPLPDEEAWNLFCMKAFKNKRGECPSDLKDLGQEIVKRCEGLPLIISEIGRVFSTKLDDMQVQEWRKMSQSLGYFLEQDLTGIFNRIMRICYHDLPHDLKSCLLYFGLFPKGLVGQARLIRLWIAEGFIRADGLTMLEYIAENHIKQLVDMNLVEECKDSTGKTKTLRVCHFLHEILIFKMKESGFCQTIPKNSIHMKFDGNIKPRRLSIHINHGNSDAGDNQVVDSITMRNSRIRALLCPVIEELPRAERWPLLKGLMKTFWNNNRLLKVLDLTNAPIDDLPKQVGMLLNLRYLSLRNTRVQRLPRSIGKLQDLQTLDLKQTLILELPSEINELHKLRHLLNYCYEYRRDLSPHVQKIVGTKIASGTLEKFGDLQNLAFIDLESQSKVVMDLRNLRQLRRLGITGLKLEDGKELCAAIEEMKSLQTLSVYSENLSEVINLDHFSYSPPLTLKRLYLNGPLMPPFPSWIFDLQHLVKLRLRWSLLEVDPLEILGTLPNLVELQFLEAYCGDELQFGKEGFKKLKVLNLLDLKDLKYLFIDKDALPLLQLMSIGESPKLNVPMGIEYLSRLETLYFFNMPTEFASSLERNGRHYSVVKHVSEVSFKMI